MAKSSSTLMAPRGNRPCSASTRSPRSDPLRSINLAKGGEKMHLSTAMKRVITLPGMTVAFALLGATPAVADGPPKMTMVSAHFIATEVTGHRREVTCTGQNGRNHELRQTWLGTSIQDIPIPVLQMTGNFDGTLVIRSRLLWKLPTTPNAA